MTYQVTKNPCPECAEAMIEPADRCGFCVVEREMGYTVKMSAYVRESTLRRSNPEQSREPRARRRPTLSES